MPIVDFFTSPDEEAHREALAGAFDGIYIEDGELAAPSDPRAVVGLLLPDDLSRAEAETRATLVRKRIVHVLGEEATEISFRIASG
ncbi:MAG: hypothetical protein PGN13_13205 [Patulibacter minatonensis]